MEGPRPDYVDLGFRAGIAVQASDPVPAGGRVAIDVTVHNYGFRAAHVQQLFIYIYVRGPRGENLDTLLGGGDHDPHPIPPGGERRIQRIAEVFGRAPGTYTIGVSYLSDQQQWIGVPALAGGTRNEVTVRVVDAQRSPAAPWRSLGGILNSAPAAGANADGRLEDHGEREHRAARVNAGLITVVEVGYVLTVAPRATRLRRRGVASRISLCALLSPSCSSAETVDAVDTGALAAV